MNSSYAVVQLGIQASIVPNVACQRILPRLPASSRVYAVPSQDLCCIPIFDMHHATYITSTHVNLTSAETIIIDSFHLSCLRIPTQHSGWRLVREPITLRKWYIISQMCVFVYVNHYTIDVIFLIMRELSVVVCIMTFQLRQMKQSRKSRKQRMWYLVSIDASKLLNRSISDCQFC